MSEIVTVGLDLVSLYPNLSDSADSGHFGAFLYP